MRTFEEWLEDNNQMLLDEMSVSAWDLINYMNAEEKNVDAITAVIFWDMGSFVFIEEMSYTEKIDFVWRMIRKYKRMYYEECTGFKIIK